MEKTITIKLPSVNKWFMVSIVLAMALIASIFFQFSTTAYFAKTATLSPEEVGKKVIDYINNNLVSSGKAELIGVKDIGTVYEVDTSYQGREIPVYATKDGKIMFLHAFNLTETKEATSSGASEPSQTIPKSDKPNVKLFVMSYCPYGIQAEKALLPVMKLLGDKANITIHFVDYAMHGEKEVYENLRQYCIQKDQPEKFYDYLLCFVQSGDYQKCLSEANVDLNKLNRCMNETDKAFGITEKLNNKSTWYGGSYPPFDVEKELNQKYGVQGSPTMVINDKEVYLTRSPEAFKEAICSAFTQPPEECNQKLSSEQASPGIGPLTGTSSSSSGSCG